MIIGAVFYVVFGNFLRVFLYFEEQPAKCKLINSYSLNFHFCQKITSNFLLTSNFSWHRLPTSNFQVNIKRGTVLPSNSINCSPYFFTLKKHRVIKIISISWCNLRYSKNIYNTRLDSITNNSKFLEDIYDNFNEH